MTAPVRIMTRLRSGAGARDIMTRLRSGAGARECASET